MLKSKIEAILFLTDKPMKAQVIARTLNEDVQVVRQGLLELIHDYEERQGGLEVADDNGYIIQVKDEYSSLINEFAPLDMPLALLRTLSAIAIKQPVQQSEIIKIRGAGAYDHVRELITRELIIKKEADEGRSPLLSTTKKFQEYFRLSGDGKSLRTELRKKEPGAERPLVQAEPEDSAAVELQIDASSLDERNQTSALLDGTVREPELSLAGTDAAEPPPLSDFTQDKAVEQLEEIFDASPDHSLVFPGPALKRTDALSSDSQALDPVQSSQDEVLDSEAQILPLTSSESTPNQ